MNESFAVVAMAGDRDRQLMATAPPLMRFMRCACETRSRPLIRILPSSRNVIEPSPHFSVRLFVASTTSSSGISQSDGWLYSAASDRSNSAARGRATRPTTMPLSLAGEGRQKRTTSLGANRSTDPSPVSRTSQRTGTPVTSPVCATSTVPSPPTALTTPRARDDVATSGSLNRPFASMALIPRWLGSAHHVLLVVKERITHPAHVVAFELHVKRVHHELALAPVDT